MSWCKESQTGSRWQLISESEGNCSGNSKGWAKQKKPHCVSVISDGMSPNTDLIESIKENSKKAQDKNMIPSDSSSQSHVSYHHWHRTYYCLGHSHFSFIWAFKSPLVRFEHQHEVRSISQCVIVIIISQPDSDPETSYDKVVLDRKN